MLGPFVGQRLVFNFARHCQEAVTGYQSLLFLASNWEIYCNHRNKIGMWCLEAFRGCPPAQCWILLDYSGSQERFFHSSVGHNSKRPLGASLHLKLCRKVNFLGILLLLILPICPQQLHTGNALHLSTDLREVLCPTKAWEIRKEEIGKKLLEVSGQIDLQGNRKED